MHVVVIGAGEVGYHVAERLSNEQHDVVVVDLDPGRLEYVSSHLDVAVVEGSGVSPAVLTRAGVERAGLLLACTNQDEVNLVSCVSARGPADMLKVARVSNPELYGDGQLLPEQFGVHVLVNPERELALDAMRLLQSTAATDVAVFAGGAVQLVRLTVTDAAPIAGRRLADIGAEQGDRPILTVAVERGEETVVPTGTTEVHAGDNLYVVAAAKEIPRALALCGYESSSVRRVMLAGGSTEAFYLAELLEQHGIHATLLVADRARAQDLAERLHKTLILHGDATDVELLEMEGVGGADAFVALTEHDDTNILSSLVAKHAGAKQVITLVNRSEYVPLVRRIGIDAAVSPRLSAANAILRYVRRGSVTRVATFVGSQAEAIAFRVSPRSPLVDRPLADIDFPEGAIVAAIVRGRDVTVPRGRHMLRAGDTAIVFALPDAVHSVTTLFPA